MQVYYKIMQKGQCKLGLNTCQVFCDIKNIFTQLNYGDLYCNLEKREFVCELHLPHGTKARVPENKPEQKDLTNQIGPLFYCYSTKDQIAYRKTELYADKIYVTKIMSLRKLSTIEYLVAKGADIHVDNESIVDYSVENGNLDIVKFLFNNGATTVQSEQKDLLKKCSANLPMVKYLASKSKVVEYNNSLISACASGDLSAVKYFIKRGADVNAFNGEPLCAACEPEYEGGGDLSVVKYLVEHGAKINEYGGWPLVLACRNHHFNIVKYLVSKGADIHIQDDECIIKAVNTRSIAIVEYLLLNGINVNAQDGEPLIDAVRQQDLSMVQYLVSQGANIHAQDDKALHIAITRGYTAIVNFLTGL